MSKTPVAQPLPANNAAVREMNDQADRVRAELDRLRRDLAAAQHQLEGLHSAQLLEANEQLILAAFDAESRAEATVSHLTKLARSSQRDALTDTPNRALMLDRLENAIAAARRRQIRIAVLFIDLDGFKPINDALGHAVGDLVLSQVARRLEGAVRESDTVSRIGGDEFLVLLSEIMKASDAALIARKILAALRAPCRFGGEIVRLSASIGIACYPDDGEDATTLISHADEAMYISKKDGAGQFRFGGESENRHGEPATVDPQITNHRRATVEQRPRSRDLREANEKLVLATLAAQELEGQAADAQQRQIKFLAMVAHELRNPLMPLRTAGDLLHRALGDEKLLTRLQDVIKRQVVYMARLIDDLLDGSRVSAGKFRLDRTRIHLGQVLAAAVDSCRPAADARQQRLTVVLPPDDIVVDGDAVRLTQVFGNLLDNASKYTPAQGRITVTAELREHSIAISVSDNGMGITAEALPHIFDLFVQDARSQAIHSGGLGIGLAVVRELVEGHGGTVTAHSAGKDQGSEFQVVLPLAVMLH